MQNPSLPDPKKLSWQCRRGIKEVEVLLCPYFERHYESLPTEDKQLFARFLEEQDVDMFEWFTTRSRPSDPELARMVDMILQGNQSGHSPDL